MPCAACQACGGVRQPPPVLHLADARAVASPRGAGHRARARTHAPEAGFARAGAAPRLPLSGCRPRGRATLHHPSTTTAARRVVSPSAPPGPDVVPKSSILLLTSRNHLLNTVCSVVSRTLRPLQHTSSRMAVGLWRGASRRLCVCAQAVVLGLVLELASTRCRQPAGGVRRGPWAGTLCASRSPSLRLQLRGGGCGGAGNSGPEPGGVGTGGGPLEDRYEDACGWRGRGGGYRTLLRSQRARQVCCGGGGGEIRAFACLHVCLCFTQACRQQEKKRECACAGERKREGAG